VFKPVDGVNLTTDVCDSVKSILRMLMVLPDYLFSLPGYGNGRQIHCHA